MPSEKLEKLKHERYVAERKLTAARHREKQLESEMKQLTRSVSIPPEIEHLDRAN